MSEIITHIGEDTSREYGTTFVVGDSVFDKLEKVRADQTKHAVNEAIISLDEYGHPISKSPRFRLEDFEPAGPTYLESIAARMGRGVRMMVITKNEVAETCHELERLPR